MGPGLNALPGIAFYNLYEIADYAHYHLRSTGGFFGIGCVLLGDLIHLGHRCIDLIDALSLLL